MAIHNKQATTYMNIGMIIGQVNRVEMEINNIIAAQYTMGAGDAIRDAFLKDVLYSGMITLDGKLKLIATIAKAHDHEMSKDTEKALNSWKVIRNTVAHGITGINPNDGSAVVFYDGTSQQIDRLRESFGEKQDRIVAYLNTLAKVIKQA
jgi:hypothetical protein